MLEHSIKKHPEPTASSYYSSTTSKFWTKDQIKDHILELVNLGYTIGKQVQLAGGKKAIITSFIEPPLTGMSSYREYPDVMLIQIEGSQTVSHLKYNKHELTLI